MKKFTSIIARLLMVMLVLAPIGAFATATTAPGATTNVLWNWDVERDASTSFSHGGATFPDTITSTGDSCILLKNYQFNQGYEYLIQRGPSPYSTTTTGDSVFYRCDFKDANKTYLYTVYIDTVVGANGLKGGLILLSVNRQNWAPYVDIVITSTALSSRLFVTSYATTRLLKRKPVGFNKPWPFN